LSRWHRRAIVAALLAGVPLAALVAAFVAGVSINVAPAREFAAQRASAALGRAVVLPGTLRVTLGRELTLHIGGLQVTNPPGFSGEPLLAVGRATIVLGLADLLRGAVRVRRGAADDVALSLERAADGRVNWASAAAGEDRAGRPDLDLGPWRLQRVAVSYHDARDAIRRDLAFESVTGGTASDGSLHLQLQGLVDARPAYRVALECGPLRLLQSGAGPWPFSVALKANGAGFEAKGALDAGRSEARVDFSARLDDPARAGRLLGIGLPPLGRVSLRGSALARADVVELTDLQGTLPGADVAGQLSWAFAGGRPRLSGQLHIVDLDLRPTLGALASARDTVPGPQSPAWQAIALRGLLPLDTEVALRVDRWSGLPVDVRDLQLRWQSDGRGLRAAIDATLAGAAANAQFDLDAASATPVLALRFSAGRVPAAELLRDLGGPPGIEGTVGRIVGRADGRGETLGAWVQSLDAAVEMADLFATHRSDSAAGLVTLALDSVTLQAPRGERLRGQARGTLQGERIAVSARGARLHEMLIADALPIELEVAAAPATLRVATDLATWRGGSEPVLSLDLQARSSGDLARWLGVSPASALPLAVNGRLRWTDSAWHLDAGTLRLGRSELAARASGPRAGSAALTTASIRSTLLDVPELSTLQATGALAGGDGGSTLPALPVTLANVDLRLDVQQLRLARTELRDIGVEARIRHGQLLPSPVRARVAGMPFDGLVEADLSGERPWGRLDLSARQVDVGRLLQELGAAQGVLQGRADTLAFSLQGRGRSGTEFLESAEARARLLGGDIAVLSPLQRPLAEMRLHEAAIDILPGQPLRGRLDGALDQTPVQVALSTGRLADLLRDGSQLPFAMAARAAGTLLRLDGTVALPLGRDADLRLQMSGERLDSLNGLSRVELPAWGPWSVDGPIRMTPGGYEVQDLQLRVGQSRLAGSGRLDLGGPRPHLALQVSAPGIRLDDFPLPPRWIDPPPPQARVDALRGVAGTLAGRTERLLSARFLRRFDADVEVQVHELLSGADRLADAALRLKLRDGRLDLDPLVVNAPGGSMRLSAAYDPKDAELDFALAAAIERFDYGIIARRLGRGNDIQGLFSLNVQVQGRAASLDKVLSNAKGRLDIAVWPAELRSGVFNLWSVNLLLSLLPLIDPGSSSAVNCVIGRFNLEDGVISEDRLLIDTTSVRVRGQGQANLQTKQLRFVFRPRAKGIAIFRLQNPLRVTGTLSDQRIGLDRRDLPESILRLIASPILWPLELFTLGPLPRDGADICTDPMRALAP
jgi:uncharacterized protein involved in outer membrane biogenesis